MSDEWLEQIAAVYRTTVGDLTVSESDVARKTAVAHASIVLRDMYMNEEIFIPIEEILNAALIRVDERDGGQADAAIRALRMGQGELRIDGVSILTLVVTLGGGRRKLWRDFNVADLDELDRLRYQNVANAKAAYDEWRDNYEAIYDDLLTAGTVARLVSAKAATA